MAKSKQEQAPINFAPQQASGQESLGGAQPIAVNTFVDKAGVIRKRPGIKRHPQAPATSINGGGLSGIHEALSGDIFAVATNGAERAIFRVTGGAATALGGGLSPSGLLGTGRPVFAETEMLLVIAGGDLMQKVELASLASSRLGGSPPVASHVITQALRLLANDLTDDRTKIRYSDIATGTVTFAGHETWLPGPDNDSGFFTAEARPDPVLALAENTNNVFCMGQTTLELFIPDPTYRFTRSAAMENGCGAIYSSVKSEQNVYWIDDLHRVLRGTDQGVDVISGPIQATLDAIDITDCFGFRVFLGPVDCIVWVFPSDGRAFAFQQDVGWSQWMGWNGTAYELFRVNCCDSYTLVGTNDGFIGQFDLGTFTDLGDDIKAYVQSGFQDHGSGAIKDCQRVQLQLKRGVSGQTPAPVASLKWRDRPGPWEEPIPIDLGLSDDTEIVVDLPSLGTYRSREWCFEFTGHEELALVSAVEYYEVTGP